MPNISVLLLQPKQATTPLNKLLRFLTMSDLYMPIPASKYWQVSYLKLPIHFYQKASAFFNEQKKKKKISELIIYAFSFP